MERKGDRIVCIYSDDGVGVQEHTNFENSTNLGLVLIKLQLQQLESLYNFETENGYKLEFSFIPLPVSSEQ